MLQQLNVTGDSMTHANLYSTVKK